MHIRLTPKQLFLLHASAIDGMVAYISDSRSTAKLSKLGLIKMEDGWWHATPKGRAVLNVIDTGEVTMFPTD